jgi:hypothetical protein
MTKTDLRDDTTRARSDRNGGRHQIRTVRGPGLEYPGGIVGIRTSGGLIAVVRAAAPARNPGGRLPAAIVSPLELEPGRHLPLRRQGLRQQPQHGEVHRGQDASRDSTRLLRSRYVPEIPLRPPAIPTPVPDALERLARFAASGTGPNRMVREAQKIITAWQGEPDLDPDGLRRRLETLRDDLTTGIMAAEEQAADVDHSDRAATRQAEASLKGLQAAHTTVVAELDSIDPRWRAPVVVGYLLLTSVGPLTGGRGGFAPAGMGIFKVVRGGGAAIRINHRSVVFPGVHLPFCPATLALAEEGAGGGGLAPAGMGMRRVVRGMLPSLARAIRVALMGFVAVIQQPSSGRCSGNRRPHPLLPAGKALF